MIYLTTGIPSAKREGDRVTVSFPSGKDTLEIALTYHEAMNLSAVISIEAGRGVTESNMAAEPEALIYAFPHR